MNYGIIYYSKHNMIPAARAARMSTAEYLLFIEDHSLLYEDALGQLTDCIQSADDRTVVFTLQQVYDENNAFINPVINRMPHALTGAFAIKRTVYQQIGGIDENFNYLAFTDLSWRLHSAGYAITDCPVAKVKNNLTTDQESEYVHSVYEKYIFDCKWTDEDQRKQAFDHTMNNPHPFPSAKAKIKKLYISRIFTTNSLKKYYKQNNNKE